MKPSLIERIKLAIFYCLARRLPDCKTITPKLSESLDRKFDLWSRLIMNLHMFTCGPCRRYLHQVRFVKEAMNAVDDRLQSDPDSRVRLSADAKDRIRQNLQRELANSY